MFSEVFRLQISQGRHILIQGLSSVSGEMESEAEKGGAKSRQHSCYGLESSVVFFF